VNLEEKAESRSSSAAAGTGLEMAGADADADFLSSHCQKVYLKSRQIRTLLQEYLDGWLRLLGAEHWREVRPSPRNQVEHLPRHDLLKRLECFAEDSTKRRASDLTGELRRG
jgi:hypothetical protein